MAILAAVDGEQLPSATVDVGADLARAFDEELVVLHVMPQETFEEFAAATSPGGGSFDLPLAGSLSYAGTGRSEESRAAPGDTAFSVEDGQREAASVAQSVVDETLDDQLDVVTAGQVGEPTAEILDEAERRDARYLVIGGQQRTPVGKAVFGSTTQSILLDADLPVVTVMHEE